MSKNYYDVLGVSRSATPDEIKTAFRQLSKKYHPDVNKDPDAEEKFKEINEAYSILSDPKKKQMFDAYGTVDPNDMGGFGGPGFDPFSGWESMFRRGPSTSEPIKEKGDDLKIALNVDFEDIFKGCHKKIKLTKKCTCHRCNGSGSESNATTTCHKCNGTGMFTQTSMRGNMFFQNTTVCPDCHGTGNVIKDPCPACGGTGLESKQVDVEFDIPAGMFENAYFIVRGKGNDGPHRGYPGDLLVTIRENPSHNGLKRDTNNNILYNLKLPYSDLVFGCDAELPYIGTKLKIHVDAGTETGKILRIPRKGMPDPNNPMNMGDYIVTINCQIPKVDSLSQKQKDLIKKLKK